MDIVRDVDIDWLGKKWIFISISAVLAVAGAVSLFIFAGLNLGVDFTGGTLVYVKFKDTPDIERVRTTLNRAQLSAQEVTRFDDPEMNEVQIRMAQIQSEETEDLGRQSQPILEALVNEFDKDLSGGGKEDLNSVSRGEISGRLQELDPEGLRSSLSIEEYATHYDGQAAAVVEARNSAGGLISEFSRLNGIGLPESVVKALNDNYFLGSFTILSVESVGPKVGRELQERARDAVLFSLLGMLIYIAFRFRPIYGLAAIVALFHDVFITLGFFSLTGKEISLTVIAALLTLVGYSINDTIVIFDRIRENLKFMRRSNLYAVINASINQTLNRTIMTSGMTFLAVFSLFLLGGEALSGFSFALVIGIIVGTYSSVAIASPIVLWWDTFREKRKSASR